MAAVSVKRSIALYPARSHGKIIKVPLIRCIFTDRTIGMTSLSVGTNPTTGTNGPSGGGGEVSILMSFVFVL